MNDHCKVSIGVFFINSSTVLSSLPLDFRNKDLEKYDHASRSYLMYRYNNNVLERYDYLSRSQMMYMYDNRVPTKYDHTNMGYVMYRCDKRPRSLSLNWK